MPPLIRAFLVAACLLRIPTCYGDVTLRYQFDFATNAALPAPASQALSSQMQLQGKDSLATFIKGSKTLMTTGRIQVLTDSEQKIVRLLDIQDKEHATVPAADYNKAALESMREIQAQRKARGTSGPEIKIQLTGKTRKLHEIQCAEREFAIVPEGGSQLGGKMQLLFTIWSPVEEEYSQNQVLQTIVAQYENLPMESSTATNLQKLVGEMWQSEGFPQSLIEELNALKFIAEMQISVKAPELIQVFQSQQLPEGERLSGSVKSPDSLFEITMKIVELSENQLPQSQFEVPDGYREVPSQEALLRLFPKRSTNLQLQ